MSLAEGTEPHQTEEPSGGRIRLKNPPGNANEPVRGGGGSRGAGGTWRRSRSGRSTWRRSLSTRSSGWLQPAHLLAL